MVRWFLLWFFFFWFIVTICSQIEFFWCIIFLFHFCVKSLLFKLVFLSNLFYFVYIILKTIIFNINPFNFLGYFFQTLPVWIISDIFWNLIASVYLFFPALFELNLFSFFFIPLMVIRIKGLFFIHKLIPWRKYCLILIPYFLLNTTITLDLSIYIIKWIFN